MQITPIILADTAAWVSLGVGSLLTIVDIAIGVVLFRISRIVELHDRERRESIEAQARLKHELHETTTKLIDERFRAITHDVANHANTVMLKIDEITQRLQSGEQEFDALAGSDHRIEMAIVAKLDTVKDWFREMFAEHEKADAEVFRQIGDRVGQMATQVGVLASKVEHAGIIHAGTRRAEK